VNPPVYNKIYIIMFVRRTTLLVRGLCCLSFFVNNSWFVQIKRDI